MDVDAQGHILLADGRTTNPWAALAAYVGSDRGKVAFDYLMLPDGRVVLHSAFVDPGRGTAEDYIYEVVQRREAVQVAEDLINDAAQFLQAEGYPMDWNGGAVDLLRRLAQEVSTGLH